MRHRPQRGRPVRRRRQLTLHLHRLTAAIALLAVAAVGCTSDDEPTSARDTADPSATDAGLPDAPFRADLNQNRIQEGSRDVNAKLTNVSGAPLTVSTIALHSTQFEPMPPAEKGSTFTPGATIDLVVEYGEPTCEGELEQLAYDVTLDDGSTITVPVNRHGVAWIRRLYDRDCALDDIHSIASIAYADTSAFTREQVDGELKLVGDLVIKANPEAAPDASFTVDEVFGSVLVNFGARSADELPRTFTASEGELRLPLSIGAFRCDPHARGESSQTFLWSVYLTPSDGPQVRLILTPDQHLKLATLNLIDDVCADPHGDGTAGGLTD